MRHPVSSLIAGALTFFSAFATAAEIRFGSLQVNWPEGFSPVTTTPPFEPKGAAGEKVLVTVMRPGRDISSESATAEQEKMAVVGSGLLRQQGEKAGKVTIPLSRSVLPDGSLLFFIGSETSSFFSSGFFLQYFVVSPGGRLGFFTIEGKGNPEEQHVKFLPVITTVTWLP